MSSPTPESLHNTQVVWTQYADAYSQFFGKPLSIEDRVFYPLQILSLLSDAQEAGTCDGTLPQDSRVNAMINAAKLMLTRMIENAINKNSDIQLP